MNKIKTVLWFICTTMVVSCSSGSSDSGGNTNIGPGDESGSEINISFSWEWLTPLPTGANINGITEFDGQLLICTFD